MLLIAVDVPPLGPSPVMPGGEWPGVNFALGTHGPARTGTLVRLEPGAGNQAGSTPVARFAIHTSGATLTFTVPRRALGSPRWFVFSVAAARESANRGNGGGLDLVPGRGTLRYVLRG